MALVFEAVYPAQRLPYPMAHAMSTKNTSSTGDSPFARAREGSKPRDEVEAVLFLDTTLCRRHQMERTHATVVVYHEELRAPLEGAGSVGDRG